MRRLWFAIPLLIAALVSPSAASAEQAAKGGAAGKARATAASPVNLNSASVAQLQTLPGIGASAAQRIVDYRQKNGSFKKIEEILETARSRRYLLTILRVSVHRPVARNR